MYKNPAAQEKFRPDWRRFWAPGHEASAWELAVAAKAVPP